jgi:tRNA A-37 threonylcarbamoyl transferase component Bud32/tetratricopeptide (TPR) repeat protein
MADGTTPWMSYALMVGVAVGGSLIIRRMIVSFNAQNQTEESTPLQSALAEGRHADAGRLLMEAGDFEAAARKFVQAGRVLDAARAFRKAERWDKAADLFEEAKDYASAAQCYRRLGHAPAHMRMLEAGGDYVAAAELSETLGDPVRVAQLWLKAKQPEKAALWWNKAGKPAKAVAILAPLAEQKQDWPAAVELWRKAGDLERARAALEQTGDAMALATFFAQEGKLDEAAKRLEALGHHLEAAAMYEDQGDWRRAALNFQRGGDTERALHNLLRDGDKLAALKMRAALGQTDEALRLALSIGPTESAYLEAAQLAAGWLVERGDTLTAARILVPLLDAGLSPDRHAELGRLAAEGFLAAGEWGFLRHVVERLTPVIGQDHPLQSWLEGLRRRLTEQTAALALAAAPQPALLGAAGSGTDKRLPAARSPGAAERTQGIEESTLSYMGDGEEEWPAGVPRALSERYENLARVGQGGNGVVFRATDKLLGRNVVLKFMIEGTMPSEMARKYFLREVKLAASLNHSNIVHIYDMGTTDDVLWYCMEFVEGAQLTSYLPIGQPVLDRSFLLSILEQLTAALDYAHSQGLVHRDIKPDNVLIARDGTLKLLDFGLARFRDESFGEQSVLAGTPYYMAPEQLDGSSVDHRADIYALGVVLYRMFTGQLPFTEGNVFVSHAVEPVPDPRKWVTSLPQGIVDVLFRAMAKKPVDRYSSCREILKDVKQALGVG